MGDVGGGPTYNNLSIYGNLPCVKLPLKIENHLASSMTTVLTNFAVFSKTTRDI